MKKIIIYTDGSCLGNPGPGGWAAILFYNQHRKEITGGENNTTNNRMELTAAIQGLKSLSEPCQIDLYTDSKYVQQGITEYIYNWQKNGWKTKSGAVKNIDLWQQLAELNNIHNVKWLWVKAHVGDEYNELANQLAIDAANKIKLTIINA